LPLKLNTDIAFQPPDRSYSFYLLDYWNIRPDLLIEMGLFKDIAKSSRLGFAEPIYNNKWSPRLGINYQVNKAHTLRLALQESVNTHFMLSPLTASLVPPDIGSFPWQINVEDGSLIREAGTAWEAQWDAKTFSVLRLDALRVSRPAYETDADGQPFRVNFMWKRYQASFTVNRILGQYFGLSLGALAKKTDPTWNGFNDYKEYNGFAKLVFWHPSGWWAWINPFLVKQDLTDRGDNLFGLLNTQVGYQFPGKRGLAALEVNNLLNRHFFYEKDPPAGLDVIFPQRRIMFKLALFF
jgi:outer membrane receptor protein involved in Fe transport